MAPRATAPVKFAGRTYLIEVVLVMALYVGGILLRPWLVEHASGQALKFAATVLPVMPVWLMLVVAWRYYLHIDEFERHRFLVTLAIAFGIGSCAIVTYAFLMDAGLPKLAITWAWPTLACSWALTSAIMSLANAHEK